MKIHFLSQKNLQTAVADRAEITNTVLREAN